MDTVQTLIEDLIKKTTYLNEQNVAAQGVVDQVKGALGELNAKIDQVNGLTSRVEQDVKDRADNVGNIFRDQAEAQKAETDRLREVLVRVHKEGLEKTASALADMKLFAQQTTS